MLFSTAGQTGWVAEPAIQTANQAKVDRLPLTAKLTLHENLSGGGAARPA